MDALKRFRGVGVPRAFANHKTPEGAAYRRYVTAILARLGPLPADAATTLREAGRLAVELQCMGAELEAARGRVRRRAAARRDASRLRRQMVPMRTQLLTLERRLEELAASAPRRSFRDRLADEAAATTTAPTAPAPDGGSAPEAS